MTDEPKFSPDQISGLTDWTKGGKDMLTPMTDEVEGAPETLLVMQLRSGLDNADRGPDGHRQMGGVLGVMREAADALVASDKRIAELEAVLVHISGLSEHRDTERMEAINNSALNYILHKALPKGETRS